MSIRNVQQSDTSARGLNSARPAISLDSTQDQNKVWVRNPFWLQMPTVTAADEKFVALIAIFPGSTNYIAMTVAGAYTVDWGDGTTTNYTTGSTANYTYDYNDVDLAGTNYPVTFTDAGDIVTLNNHGFQNNQNISFAIIDTTTGIVAGETYFVINVTTNTFQLSNTLGGSAITLTNDGTGSILGYKQAIVVVTPQSGQNITSFNLNVRNSAISHGHATGWMDISASLPNLTTAGLTISALVQNVYHTNLQNIDLWNIGSTNTLNYDFYSLFSLARANVVSSSVTNLANAFQNCYSLVEVNLPQTQNVTTFNNTFSACRSLVTVKSISTSSCTDFTAMFSGCRSLQFIPNINTSSGTTFNQMFLDCQSLQYIPSIDLSLATTLTSIFGNCYSLKSVPQLNIGSATNAQQMFDGCSSLTYIPSIKSTGALTTITSMFQNCSSLVIAPYVDFGSATAIGSLFSGCWNLRTIPNYDFSSVGSGGVTTSAFTNCASLMKASFLGPNNSFSLSNCNLGASELNEIYTNLPTVVGKTITVSGNPGTAGDDPTIATAKGWTVV